MAMASAAGPALSSTSKSRTGKSGTGKSSTDKSSTSILTGTGAEEASVLALEALGFKVVQRNVILDIHSRREAKQDMQIQWHLLQVDREHKEGKCIHGGSIFAVRHLRKNVFRKRFHSVCLLHERLTSFSNPHAKRNSTSTCLKHMLQASPRLLARVSLSLTSSSCCVGSSWWR